MQANASGPKKPTGQAESSADDPVCGRCGERVAAITITGPDAADGRLDPCGHAPGHLEGEL